MVSKEAITKWQSVAPWSSIHDVEQDLIICRTLVALFSDDFLRSHLAFRGGTALNKLYVDPAPRYSEDIDLVQIKPGPIKPILKRIGEVVDYFEEKRTVKQKAHNNTVVYKFNPEYDSSLRMKLKIEINCREHFNLYGFVTRTLSVENEWFTGSADITTYKLEELLGTKLRALYQRKKGRDLFDLHHFITGQNPDIEQIIAAYERYMNESTGNVPTRKQFLMNMDEKRDDSRFAKDVEGLLRTGVRYSREEAFENVVNVLSPLMR